MSTQEHITISSIPSEKESKNFDFLREEGIAYLQKVAGKIWTDFNVHDPGLTILEALCYAITDLGYRANLDIEDILAINEQDDTEKELNNFFTAREILTNAPFTINDYRKLLIDVEGIKNAWFDITTESEIDFYVDKVAKELTYTENADTTKIDLNGLYEVLLELDESEKFGDMNDNTLITEITIDSGDLSGLELEVSVEFPYWSFEWDPGKGWENLEDIKDEIKSIAVTVEKDVNGYEVEVSVSASNEITVSVADTTSIPYTDQPALAADVKAALDALFDETGAGDDNLLVLQQEKVEETFAIVQKGKDTVHANRNLCEDFVRFNALKIEEILLCADIEITSEADTEEVLAEIYYQVGQFLAPDINFYSFSEMLEKDKTTEEIFEGPRLDHGFIDTDELENSSRRTSIHVSDIISIIMDIEGVIAVKEIEIANIPLGDSTITSKSALWCLELAWDKNFVPRLTMERSKIVFIKKGIPFVADQDEVEELLEAKKAAARAQNSVIPELDLPIPNGTHYNLDDYTSIQIDFPINYGIGEIGLSDSVSDLRKAQANQLKGFLLFFDQFLANYCSQLSHVKELFSMNSDIDQTYFHQSLFDIPNVANLYKDFIEYAGLGTDPADDDKTAFKASWQAFMAKDDDPIVDCDSVTDGSHKQSLRCIVEDEDTFLERRSAFLDHLMARFCEQFTDYAMLAYKLDGKKITEELIEDKLAFLQEYPEVSYGRGQAFNYKEQSWDTDNVSGLEKRVTRLLGIESYTRRDLACPPPATNFIKYKDTGGKWRFRFRSPDGEVLLRSEAYNSFAARNKGIKSVLKNGTDESNYDLEESVDGKFYYNLKAQNNQVIGTSNMYASEDEREEALIELITRLNGECSGEGMYLIEHILLRPRTEDDDFIPVSFKEDCYCEGNEDAWSFRATCVLPYWIGRFTNMDFRAFVERTIREEAPAHIFMKICWVDQDQMSEFQTAYEEWLSAMKECPVDQTTLTEKQNNLITILYALRNVYPVSNLYDCQESNNSPVRLGQSILGTFIPEENE